MQSAQEDDNWISLLLLLVGASGFGLVSFGAIFRPVQEWFVEVGVLVPASQALVPLGDVVGLDFWRVLIAGGFMLGLIALVVLFLSRRKVAERG